MRDGLGMPLGVCAEEGEREQRDAPGGYGEAMPMPRRSSVDDFFARLNDVQRPHLEALRELSRDADPEAREELKWNLPVYLRGKNTSL